MGIFHKYFELFYAYLLWYWQIIGQFHINTHFSNHFQVDKIFRISGKYAFFDDSNQFQSEKDIRISSTSAVFESGPMAHIRIRGRHPSFSVIKTTFYKSGTWYLHICRILIGSAKVISHCFRFLAKNEVRRVISKAAETVSVSVLVSVSVIVSFGRKFRFR